MCSDVAIRVENLSKCYQIYDKPSDRLKQSLYPKVQHLLGREPRQYFKEFWALKNVSFEVKKGETVGIIGRNGSGKSTLLQMICGTLTPTSGSVQTFGRVAALLELGSGFNPEFTGRENVYLNAAILGLSKEEIDQKFDAIAAFADIGEHLEQPVKTYSSGMFVRLAFAVIAHVDADILIVDEALAVGDAFFTQKCMRFLREFMKTGTVLFVSHDTGAVVNLCTSAMLIRNGINLLFSTPKEVIEEYLVDLYESTQNVDGVLKNKISIIENNITETKVDYKDFRSDLIESSHLRNDIEIFKFNPDRASFGTGDAEITSTRILDKNQIPLSWIIGGEDVILEIQCIAHKKIYMPIIGFIFKDKLGQVIFADNTYLSYMHTPQTINKNEVFIAQFIFRLPILPSGEYTVSPAIAEGTQENHVQHHWVHDALLIKVHASQVCFGLLAIPMKEIRLITKSHL
ncbi:ABC transporter ATP-binding protein [Thiofilum flexile]|uniref:ABC transporter ATP-binding protein n=1 Tax=Thiofilum flexile TaxID=125627 RepID=UPI0003737C50|nr:ABC transporter ATP-binding protein [Thiofilum flexile]